MNLGQNYKDWVDGMSTDPDSLIHKVDYSAYYTSANSAAIPTYRATLTQNLCTNNYLILSNCFYLQGF